ncbi:hypothetical protein GGR32_002421, partial [Mesonia hippocampi]
MKHYYQTQRHAKSMFTLLFALWATCTLTAQTPSTSNILYVNKNVVGGTQTGNSWANAIPELADALKWARTQHDANNSWLQNDSLQIYVAKGTYKPLYNAGDGNYSVSGNRDNAFVMVKNVQLYGNFDPENGITDLSHQRYYSLYYETTLSGDFNDDDYMTETQTEPTFHNNGENAHHVIISTRDVGNALIDGFNIISGNADDSESYIAVNNTSVNRGFGAGIINFSSSPSITNVYISRNEAVSGGGIMSFYNSSNIENIEVMQNKSVYGGGIYNYGGSPSITNVKIRSNSSVQGGGIYNNVNSSPSISDTEIAYNYAADFGGGICNITSSPTIIDTEIKENESAYGGGIYNNTSSPGISNTVLYGNEATYGGGIYNNGSSPSIINVHIDYNSASSQGGGIFNGSNSAPNISATSITNNSADNGGGICNNSSSPTILNSIIAHNFVNYNGGGLMNLSNSAPSIINSNVIYNNATYDGGGMVNYNTSAPSFKNSIIYGNAPDQAKNFDTSAPAYEASLIQNSKPNGIWNTNLGTNSGNNIDANPLFKNPNSRNFKLQENSPVINTGDNSLYTGDILNDTDLLGSSRLSDNSIDMGAIEYQNVTPIPNISNILYVDKNVVGGTQAGDSWANAIPELSDALKWARTRHDADNNWLQNDSLQIYVAQGMYVPEYHAEDGQYTYNGNRNNAFVMVKNVQLYGGFDPANNITDLTHLRYLHSTAGSVLSGEFQGDGYINNNNYNILISSGDVGNALIDGFYITGGSASGYAQVTVNNNNVNNSNGGGIYTINASPSIVNTEISYNEALNNGGGIYTNNSSSNILNTTIENNYADAFGGGIYNETSSLNIRDVKISNNRGRQQGGGIYNETSSLNIVNSDISRNTATGNGGGIFNNTSSPVILNSVIKSNSVSANGGGIYNQANSVPEIINTRIVSNTSNRGGGIFNTTSSSNIINTTISRNYARGGSNAGSGIYNYESSPTIKNSIIYGNTTSEIINSTNSSPNFSHSIVYASTLNGVWDTNLGIDNGNNLDADPLFINSLDFSLRDGSPAIDAGDNTAYTNAGGDLNNDTDLAGNTRLFGSTIDIGAFEHHGIKTYWTGNINTDWHTAGNWTSGLPSTTTNAVIDQVTNQPLVAATNSAEAYSIVINPGASLSVLGELSFQTSLTNHGDLLFLSNANATGQLTELPEGA